jgi:RimJ/RimL family protein N-acetyltransferase
MPSGTTFPELLETERLVMRRYSSTDVLSILRLVDRDRDRLIQNFAPMAKSLLNLKDANSFVEEKAEQWNSRKASCYGIWFKGSEELIGQLQAKNIVWDVPAAELSYFIGSSSQRQGFAKEAISAILRFAFEQLDFKRIFVRIIPSNKESLLLAKKLGFKYEGLHRNEFRCGFGELHDVNYFSFISDDWRASPASV